MRNSKRKAVASFVAALGFVLIAAAPAFAVHGSVGFHEPDVGEDTGSVLDAGLDAVLDGIVDLAPWLIPAGLVVMTARAAVRSFSRGRSPGFGDSGSRKGHVADYSAFRKGGKYHTSRKGVGTHFTASGRSVTKYRR